MQCNSNNNNNRKRINNCNSVNSLCENEINSSTNPVSNETNENEDAFTSLKNVRLANKNGLIIGYLNINSIRNKFLSLKTLISDNIDILIIAETKLDSTFTTAQFLIEGFQKPIRFDRNAHGGGLMIYIRDRVPAKALSDVGVPNGIECGIIEINVHKKKWILLGIYRPPSQNQKEFFDKLCMVLNTCTLKSDNFIVIGDFNTEEDSDNMSNFMNLYGLANLVKVPTCFKSDNPRCIDLILTNNRECFKSTRTIETGLSDFHSMILTVIKSSFIKRGPRIITYRDYRKFDPSVFKEDLKKELAKNNFCYEKFEVFNSVVTGVLDNHAPIKKKSVRANDGPFMTKALRRAIMTRSRLRNIYCKYRTVENLKAFKKQRNKCVTILRQAKKDYYKDLDIKNLTDNRKFWRSVKPLFNDKVKTSSTIVLMENNKIVSEDHVVATILNDHFANITKSLNIAGNNETESTGDEISDPVTAAIEKYRSHPSVILIKNHSENIEAFDFKRASIAEVLGQVDSLDTKKASPIGSIPAKVIKDNVDIVASYLLDLFNKSVDRNSFPDEMKDGDVSALFKNSDSFEKKNYRPITVLPSVSKVFERLLANQMLPIMNKFLSPKICGYRQGYNTQHALLKLVDTCKKTLDNKGFVGAVLMDLSKALDCLNHELLLAKLEAYGFSTSSIRMMHSYLTGRRQRVKVNGSFSSWKEMKLGVPQGSVLGPLLFNIFINDIFLLLNETEICNYADDTTIYCSHRELQEVTLRLENDAAELSHWFAEHLMKLDEEECHLLIFGEKIEKFQ